MEHHIVEIIVLLMKQFPQGAISPEEFEPLTKNLMGLGYTQNEIETALFWFYHRLEAREAVHQASETLQASAYRVLHDVERSVLTPNAQGYLLELRHLGLINLTEMNQILDKAVMFGGRRLDVEEIKLLVAATITEQAGPFPMPGNSFYLKTPNDRVQ